MASTPWVNRTSNDLGRIQQTYDLAVVGSGTGYTTVIKGIKVRLGGTNQPLNQYISFSCHPSTITGSNVDVNLYGCDNVDGDDKYLLKSDIVAQLTANDTKITGIVDIKAYPAPFYFISVTGDNAETGNTMVIAISGDLNGSQ